MLVTHLWWTACYWAVLFLLCFCYLHHLFNCIFPVYCFFKKKMSEVKTFTVNFAQHTMCLITVSHIPDVVSLLIFTSNDLRKCGSFLKTKVEVILCHNKKGHLQSKLFSVCSKSINIQIVFSVICDQLSFSVCSAVCY